MLTFLGSFGLYTATQMSGAASAIGAGQSGTGFLASFNPFALLQTDRLRAMLSSNTDIVRSDPFRPQFDTGRFTQPKFSFDTGRRTWSGPYQPVRPPVVHARPYR
jgi:hypothetical protein